MTTKYILNAQGEPEPTDDLGWERWFATAPNRTVAIDKIGDQVCVSTVFLTLDHGYDKGQPLLYETIIFGGPHDQYQDRYATVDEARIGHKKALLIAAGGAGA